MESNNLKKLLDASYKTTDEGNKIGNNLGYKLDRELSNRKHKVFIDNKGSPTVAFTGSRTAGDWITNGALLLGLGAQTNRFKDSKKLVNNVKKKYNTNSITAIGDSLGGTLAEHSTNRNDKIITNNKGTGLFGIGKKIKNNQTDIRTSNDIVSLLSNTQSGGKKITIKNTKQIIDPFKSHSYKNLTKLKNKIL